jgi:hypothetical protein
MSLPGADLNPSVCLDALWKIDGALRRMNPREIEDAIARDVLGWVFVSNDEADCVSGPGWYKQDRFVGWPDQWATDMDAAWKLAGELAKDGLDWQLRTKKTGSFVKLTNSAHESVEAEAGPDQMPLAMCLALLKMVDAKKTADGLKTV